MHNNIDIDKVDKFILLEIDLDSHINWKAHKKTLKLPSSRTQAAKLKKKTMCSVWLATKCKINSLSLKHVIYFKGDMNAEAYYVTTC